ncbi:rhamnulokinase [Peribacillus sp. NPDC097206]|uniref:rhamnulokinase n=1 Tax=unclassified Peribacillus TaxID=2675266 RepID=UPI00380A0A99
MVYVAVDIGASSGRLVIGNRKNEKLETNEIHRFANGFTRNAQGVLVWDIDHLLNQILRGLEKVKVLGYETCTLGIDTWAVDYVLVDDQGDYLQEPISYRDSRTENTIEKVTVSISKGEIYNKTGIQFLPFNTLYQFYEENKGTLHRTSKILMIPDYLGFALTGKAVSDVTNLSTTQLLNVNTRTFDEELLHLISLKKEKFPELVEPGTVLGELRKDYFSTYDLPEKCQVVTVATHDTASAVVGTPGEDEGWAFLSSGTWSLLGMETSVPFTNEKAFHHNYTNEWGAFGTTRLLKNIMGLWIIQEVRRHLIQDYNFSQFVEEALKEETFKQFIDFNDDRFLNPANMIEEIQGYCRETNQPVPVTAGELACCVYSNLAIIYAIALEDLEDITGNAIDRLHVVGGGAYNDLLNQLTADMSGRDVYAGPTEATAIGNLLIQLIAKEEISDLKEGRKLVRNSFEVKQYVPGEVDRMTIMNKFKEVIKYEQPN